MSQAFVNSTSLPLRPGRNPATCGRRGNVSMSQAPPESRFQQYYPSNTRFQAPTLSLQNVPGFELMNGVNLVMEEAPLDMSYAADLLASLRADYVKDTGDFKNLFVKDAMDLDASDPAERYFPMTRRFETPIIEIELDGKDPVSVSISVGSVIGESGPEVTDEAAEIAKRAGAFWKEGGARSVEQIVEANYPMSTRYLAPVIEMAFGELGFSISMDKIDGTPDKGAFEDRYMLAPSIRMKEPMGEWDKSAFIEVGCEEVQLPILSVV